MVQQVTLQIDVQPREATLELDGAPVRDNPLRLPKDGAVHRLVARAPGYVDATREVSADADGAVAIALQRATATDVRRPPPAPLERGGAKKMTKGPMETQL